MVSRVMIARGVTRLMKGQVSTDPTFAALIERSRARLKTVGGLSSDEMRRCLKLKPKAHRR